MTQREQIKALKAQQGCVHHHHHHHYAPFPTPPFVPFSLPQSPNISVGGWPGEITVWN